MGGLMFYRAIADSWVQSLISLWKFPAEYFYPQCRFFSTITQQTEPQGSLHQPPSLKVFAVVQSPSQSKYYFVFPLCSYVLSSIYNWDHLLSVFFLAYSLNMMPLLFLKVI